MHRYLLQSLPHGEEIVHRFTHYETTREIFAPKRQADHFLKFNPARSEFRPVPASSIRYRIAKAKGWRETGTPGHTTLDEGGSTYDNPVPPSLRVLSPSQWTIAKEIMLGHGIADIALREGKNGNTVHALAYGIFRKLCEMVPGYRPGLRLTLWDIQQCLIREVEAWEAIRKEHLK